MLWNYCNNGNNVGPQKFDPIQFHSMGARVQWFAGTVSDIDDIYTTKHINTICCSRGARHFTWLNLVLTK